MINLKDAGVSHATQHTCHFLVTCSWKGSMLFSGDTLVFIQIHVTGCWGRPSAHSHWVTTFTRILAAAAGITLDRLEFHTQTVGHFCLFEHLKEKWVKAWITQSKMCRTSMDKYGQRKGNCFGEMNQKPLALVEFKRSIPANVDFLIIWSILSLRVNQQFEQRGQIL